LLAGLDYSDDLVFSKISNADLIGNVNWQNGLFYLPKKLLFGELSDSHQRLLFVLNGDFVTVMQYENIILGEEYITNLLEDNMYPVTFQYSSYSGIAFDGRFMYVSSDSDGLDTIGGVLQVDVQAVDNDITAVEVHTQIIENNFPIEGVSDLFYDEQEGRLYILNTFDDPKASVLVYGYDAEENSFTPVYQKKIPGAGYNMVADVVARKLYIQSTENDFLAIIDLDDYENYTQLDGDVYDFNNPISMAIDTVHHRLYVVNENGPSITVINTQDNSVVARIKNEEYLADEYDIAITSEYIDFEGSSFIYEPEWVAVDTTHNRLYVYEGDNDDDDDYILVFDTTDDAFSLIAMIDNTSLRATSGIEDDENDYFDDIETMIVDEDRNRLYVINEENAVTVIDTTDDAFSLIQWITIDYLRSISGIEDDNRFYFSEPEHAFLDIQNQKLYVPNYEESMVLVLDVSGDETLLDGLIEETDGFEFDDPYSIFVRTLDDGPIEGDFRITADWIDKGLYVHGNSFTVAVQDTNLEINFEQCKIHKLAAFEEETIRFTGQVTITNTETAATVVAEIEEAWIVFFFDDQERLVPDSGYIYCIDQNDLEYILTLQEDHGAIEIVQTSHIIHSSSQKFIQRHTSKHRNR
jgi:DNA-binding beta-propeller fold protein YncE